MAINTGRATTIAAVIVLVLAIATTAAPPYTDGGFGHENDERDECVLLCINEKLCTCNESDFEKRILCCQEYCQRKCGSGGIYNCGDLPKKPNCS